MGLIIPTSRANLVLASYLAMRQIWHDKWHRISVSRRRRYSLSGSVSTGMGDRLQAGRYIYRVARYDNQLSLAILRG